MSDKSRDNNNGIGLTFYNNYDNQSKNNLYLYSYYNKQKIGILVPENNLNEIDNMNIIVDKITLKDTYSTILYEDNKKNSIRNDLFQLFDLERDIRESEIYDNYILNDESNSNNWIKRLTYNGLGFFGISYFNKLLTSNIQIIQSNSYIDTIYNIKYKSEEYPFEISYTATNKNYSGYCFKIDTGTIGNLCLGYKECYSEDYSIYLWNENKNTFMTGIKYHNENENIINHSLFFKGNFYQSDYYYSLMCKMNEVGNEANDAELSFGLGYENDNNNNNIKKLQANFEIDNTEEKIVSKNILLNSKIHRGNIDFDYKDSYKPNDTKTHLITNFSINN